MNHDRKEVVYQTRYKETHSILFRTATDHQGARNIPQYSNLSKETIDGLQTCNQQTQQRPLYKIPVFMLVVYGICKPQHFPSMDSHPENSHPARNHR